MKGGGGFLLVLAGLLLLWMAITGRLDCLASFATCLSGGAGSDGATAGVVPSVGSIKLPTLPTVGTVPHPIYGPTVPAPGTTVLGATPGYHP